MTRTIQDADLLLWEAYATAGESGFPERAKLVFHCLTDTTRRARFVQRDGDKSAVEQEVAELPDAELLELLGRTEELS
jgi:hypothetical protein